MFKQWIERKEVGKVAVCQRGLDHTGIDIDTVRAPLPQWVFVHDA
jgi:hypothetical protein